MNRQVVRFWLVSSVIVSVLVVAAWNKATRQRLAATPPAGSTLSPPPAKAVGSVRRVALPTVDPKANVRPGRPVMYHLDQARTNRSPFVGPSRPNIAWSLDAGGAIETAIVALKDNIVAFGTLGGDVLFVDVSRRSVIYRWRAEERVYGGPTVVGDGVVIGTDGQRVVRLSSTGKLRWSLETQGEADTAPVYTSDHRLLLAAGPNLYALRSNGSLIWHISANNKMYSSPAVGSDGMAFVGCQDNRLYGIDRRGRVRFKVRMGGDVDCAPAIDDDGTVFVGSDGGRVLAMDGGTGKVKWTVKVGGHVRGGLTITRRHTVIVGTYGPAPAVVCLDGASGEQLWRFSIQGTGAREFGIHGSPVEARDGNLYFGAQDDHVYSLDSYGKLRWKVRLGGDVDAPVTLLSEGVLLAGVDDGHLVCLGEPSSE